MAARAHDPHETAEMWRGTSNDWSSSPVSLAVNSSDAHHRRHQLVLRAIASDSELTMSAHPLDGSDLRISRAVSKSTTRFGA